MTVHELVAGSGRSVHSPRCSLSEGGFAAAVRACLWFIAFRTSLPSRKYCSNNLTSGQDQAVNFSKATAA